MKLGFKDFEDWISNKDNIYIGRFKSEFANPYSAKKYGREKCIKLYERYIRNKKPELLKKLLTLKDKTLGCWCKPEACHGNILIKLLNKKPVNKDAYTLRNIFQGMKKSWIKVVKEFCKIYPTFKENMGKIENQRNKLKGKYMIFPFFQKCL